jgi:uncharacterized repeat protein (TIGR02543 family)
MKNKKALCVMMVLACAVLLPGSEPLPARVKAKLPMLAAEALPLQPNGDFVISVERGGRWQEAGRLANDRFLREQTLDLAPWLQGERRARVRIRQTGGGAAHLDAVSLGGVAPLSAKGGELDKIGRCDNDLATATDRTVELAFAVPAGSVPLLAVTGRIENKIISREPFQFPQQNTFRTISPSSSFYSYSLGSAAPPRRRFGGREWLAEVGGRRPFFSALSQTGSGHPTGTTFGWVSNDERNLYVTIDFTPDNTYDNDKDYAKVYARGNGQVREFKVSVPERRWGKAHFTYTDKVAYQHKVYDFVIPLAGLPRNAEGGLDLSFAAYGTASPMENVTINLAYDPNLRRYLAVITVMGQVVGAFVGEDGVIISPGFSIGSYGGDAELSSDVAYDTVNRRFMVIWQKYDSGNLTTSLVGRIYNDNGSPFSPDITLDTTSDQIYYPALAFDEVNQRYLAAWVVSDDMYYSHVRGQLCDSNGLVDGDSEIPISPPSSYAGTVDLAFDSLSQLYMVVWESDSVGSSSPSRVTALPAGEQIAGQMVTRDGVPSGEPFGVTSGIFANRMPSIANDSINHRFLAAFVQLSGSSDSAFPSINERRGLSRARPLAPLPSEEVIVAGQLLDRLGTIQGDAFGIGLRPDSARFWPRVAFDPVHGRYMAIWYDIESPDTPGPLVSMAVGQFLDAGGAPLETDPSENFLLGDDSFYFCPPAVAANTVCGNFLAAWMNSVGGTMAVFGGGCPQLPAVETLPLTAVTTTGALGGGNVTGDGGAPVFSRGVCWNTGGGPTIFDPHSSDGSGTGAFSSTLSGLLPATTYRVRAYASNSTGTAYGNEVEFTTFRWVVTFLADAGGILSGPTPQYVNDNGSCLPVGAAAKAGYFFRKWEGGNAFSSFVNPLSVTNVTGDLTFHARFGELKLAVTRRVERAWIITSLYADVVIDAGGLADSAAARFVVMRRVGGGGWEAQKEVLPGDFVNGHYTFASLPLEKDKIYTFRIDAYGSSGALIGMSVEVTI